MCLTRPSVRKSINQFLTAWSFIELHLVFGTQLVDMHSTRNANFYNFCENFVPFELRILAIY